ncbi:MAG: hypothetical protein BWX80_01541 [Candidatus Hydrogenedentes bacterium ADurb.Bin101]|nr:MAG: hypothetical protein BWX80_01541 [Candidatus Hydrogenedentes bacterium ADurb.Bin101]
MLPRLCQRHHGDPARPVAFPPFHGEPVGFHAAFGAEHSHRVPLRERGLLEITAHGVPSFHFGQVHLERGHAGRGPVRNRLIDRRAFHTVCAAEPVLHGFVAEIENDIGNRLRGLPLPIFLRGLPDSVHLEHPFLPRWSVEGDQVAAPFQIRLHRCDGGHRQPFGIRQHQQRYLFPGKGLRSTQGPGVQFDNVIAGSLQKRFHSRRQRFCIPECAIGKKGRHRIRIRHGNTGHQRHNNTGYQTMFHKKLLSTI